MGSPAARRFDITTHPLPGLLLPGPGSANVLIGKMAAWRGIPAMAAMMIQAAKKVVDTAIKVAEVATAANASNPSGPAWKAAEEGIKTASSLAMSAMIQGLTAASVKPGGMPDIHACLTLLPLPPHGPGVVIDGSPTVLINGFPACVQGDKVLEALGPPNPIKRGEPTVLIGDGSAGGLAGLLGMMSKLLDKMGGAIAKAVLAALQLAGGIGNPINAILQGAMAAITFLTKMLKKKINRQLQTVIEQALKGVKALADELGKVSRNAFVEPAPHVHPAPAPSRVKGMEAKAADEAIKKAQKDAVEALDKRIKDLDKWDEATKASFKKWFGADDEATRKKMRERMVKAKEKLAGFTLDNYAADDDDFAYVYHDKEDKIYLGALFGKAPATGANSKAGTLIHEVSHFDSLGHTGDEDKGGHKVYGHKAAEKLAKDDPAQAQKTADNFEYFVEDGM